MDTDCIHRLHTDRPALPMWLESPTTYQFQRIKLAESQNQSQSQSKLLHTYSST